jgi:phage gp45-like
MAASPKEKLGVHSGSEETSDEREVYLGGGRTLTVADVGSDQLVEIKSSSGMVEVRIRLTEQGPVLQMESVRLQLKASEAVEIESKRVEIKATEDVKIESEGDTNVEAKGEVRVVGKMIHLN